MILSKKTSFCLSLLILLFIFTGCVTVSSIEEQYSPNTIEWQNLNPPVKGFSQTSFKLKERHVSWHCIKIDLQTDNLDFYSYPQKDNESKTYKVKQLAKKHKAVISFNTTPFNLDGKAYLPVGITQYKNQLIYEPVENYCMLVLISDKKTSTLRAEICKTQFKYPENTDEEISAFGGFYVILEDGKINSFNNTKRSRIGVGISDNGRFLYIMAAAPDFSFSDQNGLTYEECAQIFKTLGCTSAMQLDGGHSTALVVNGKNIIKPFMQRKVPALLLFTH